MIWGRGERGDKGAYDATTQNIQPTIANCLNRRRRRSPPYYYARFLGLEGEEKERRFCGAGLSVFPSGLYQNKNNRGNSVV